jgi:hypothetical protein
MKAANSGNVHLDIRQVWCILQPLRLFHIFRQSLSPSHFVLHSQHPIILEEKTCLSQKKKKKKRQAGHIKAVDVQSYTLADADIKELRRLSRIHPNWL